MIHIETYWVGLGFLAITVKDDRTTEAAFGLTKRLAERRLIFTKLSE